MPGTRKWEKALHEALGALAEDNRSGASELIQRATREWLELLPDVPDDDLAEATHRWIRGLIEAQPSMASFLYLAARLNDEAKLGWDRTAFADRCRDLEDELKELTPRTAETAVPLLSNARAILTYSRSSTVLKALERSAALGRFPKIIISEGRPMLEGVDAARRIHQMGLDVCLTVDAALPAKVSEVDLVVIGGDSLGPGGLLNKIGTRTIVAAAREEGIPVYALCSSDKWLPAIWEGRIQIEDNDPREILPDCQDGIEISNKYFDRTPIEWLTAAVSDKGVFGIEEVIERLARLETILDFGFWIGD